MPYQELATKLKSISRAGGETIPGLEPLQAKKRLRKAISVERTSDTLGFLHAALVNIKCKNLLIAGPSGVGKTCYINRMSESDTVTRLASDWVAVEYDDGQYYASDLNYPDNILHSDRVPLDGIMFLSRRNRLDRDAYAPNQTELIELIHESFDTSNPAELEKLSSFWINNYGRLPNTSAVHARRSSEDNISETIKKVLERDRSSRIPVNVGIIGTGSVGAPLAYELGTSKFVHDIYLYNRSHNKAKGLELDFNQAFAGDLHETTAVENPEDIFRNANVVFLAFRDETAGNYNPQLPERWQKSALHMNIIEQYAQMAGETGFSGTIFVVSNPVDLLTYAAFNKSQSVSAHLRTFQLYGVGLELDVMRALYFGRKLDPNLKYEDIMIFGNHSDTFFLYAPLRDNQLNQLRQDVINASSQIRRCVPRTVYGPVRSAIRSLEALQTNGPVHATLVQEEAYMGRRVVFHGGIPMIGELPAEFKPEYDKILEMNRGFTAMFK